MRKRITGALLTLVMLLTLVPAMGTTASAAGDTRPAPDRVQSYIAASGFTATALNPNQAKFTYVEIKSNTNRDGTDDGDMTATVKCKTVDTAIANEIDYNGGNATVNSETLLNQLKTKLKDSDYHKPSNNGLSFPANSNAVRHQDIGAGTFRYLLSVEAYFNGTYYFDGAGINFETKFKNVYRGRDTHYVSVQVCGMTIYPDTASGVGDPPTKLKLVIDNQIGREFTNTNAAPNGNYGLEKYPNTYVANFRWICMPNTNLEIELRNNTVLHVGKYFRSSSSSAEIKTNIHADNLTISGNGVLLASDFNNLPYGATGTACSAIHANSLTVDSSKVVLDLTRDGSYNCIEVPTPGAFKPIDAKSIKLTAESGRWISGLSNNEASLKNAYSAYWNKFPIANSSVSFGRTATLGGATLNVGGIVHSTSDKNFNYVMGSGNNKLSVSFNAGPQWFTTYYLKNKINLNARVYIWKDSTPQTGFSIAQMSGGRTNGTLDFTLDVRNLTLVAGSTYRVYVSVSPTMNGDYLAESPLTAQWTFRTVNAPAKEKISSVSLMQDGYFMTGSSGPAISVKDTLPYEIEGTPTWVQDSSDSNVHTAEVKLKVKDTSKYEFANGVAASLSTGDSSVTGVTKNDDGTLTVSLKAYQHYQITYKYSDTAVGHELIKAGDAFVLPDKKTDGASSAAVFEGWTVDGSDTIYQPGDTYDVAVDTTFVEKWGVPSTETKPRIFVMTYDELFDADGNRSYDFTGFSLTVDRQEYVDSNFYDSVPVAIRNLGNGDSGQLTVSVVGSDEVANQVSVDDSGEKTTTVDSVPSGQFKTFEITVSRVAGAPDPEPFKAGTVKIKVEDAANSITKYFLVTINVAPGPYSLYTSAGDAAGAISGITVTADVENKDDVAPGSVVTVTAPAVAGYAFAGWKALSPVDGTTISEVTFDDERAATTTFVMPSKNVSVVATYNADTLDGIFVAAPPNKTVYTVGDTFDATGMIVMEKYHSGNTFTLNPSEYTVNSPDMTTDGTKTVTVTYTADNTKTATTTITVLPETPATYTVSYNPGEGSGTMPSGTATKGVSFILPLCTFTPPAGKVFDKWDINGTQYESGASVNISANTVVKADWKDIPAEAVKVAPPTAADPFTYAAGTTHTGVLDSGDSSKYTVTGDKTATNAGTYTAIASLSNHGYYWTDGTQQPKLIEWTINPADRAAADKPAAPEMESRTTDSITLKAITAPAGETVEYSMDGSYWQSSTTFTGLSSGTGYTFYARYAAKTNYNPSDASEGATFFTLSGGSSSGSTAYTVTVLGSKNGAVTADRKTASAGTTVTLTVSPDKGYTLDDLTVLDKNDKEIKLTAKNGKYTFTMPASNVEVDATFKAVKSGNPFVDVPSGAYYEDAVIWAVDKGVTSGTDATHFSPNGICTRAQAVTFLWRASGSPAPKSATMPFTDVPAGSYYEQAVLWAVENGITKGTSDTTFSPNATCSRAQIVTFLWRSQKSPAAGSVNPFTDVSADAYYADAVLWAVKESVTSGTTATTFSPNADCTRAQIVTFIYRALAE